MKLNSTYKANDLKFLENGGQMGDLIREMDWGNTSLGHIGNWPVTYYLSHYFAFILSYVSLLGR